MKNVVATTLDYNVNNNGNGYAKIFSMKKRFIGTASWHSNQLLFRVVHPNSYDKCIEKKYFISVFEDDDTSKPSRVVFQDLNPNTSGINMVYIDYEDRIDIYVKGSLGGARVRIIPIHSPSLGLIEFYNFQKFDNTLDGLTKIEPTQTENVDVTNSITWSGSWHYVEDRHQSIKRQGNLVVINISTIGSYFANDLTICTLPQGFRPPTSIRFVCSYEKADGTFGAGQIRLNGAGFIVIYGIPNDATAVNIAVSYHV